MACSAPRLQASACKSPAGLTGTICSCRLRRKSSVRIKIDLTVAPVEDTKVLSQTPSLSFPPCGTHHIAGFLLGHMKVGKPGSKISFLSFLISNLQTDTPKLLLTHAWQPVPVFQPVAIGSVHNQIW